MKPAFLLLLTVAAAAAQSTNGYLFFAPGGVTASGYTAMAFETGAGAALRVGKGIAANLELGALWPRGCFTDCVTGIFSPGGAYHFRRGADRQFDPFVNGGYSLMFRSGRENLFYFGGGANYWISKAVGVRMEFRDRVATLGTVTHFWGFRAGLAFR